MFRLAILVLRAFFHTVRGRLRHGPLRPSWGFRFEWMIRGLRSDSDDMTGWPAYRIRAELEQRPYPRATVKRVERRAATIGVPGEWFVPPGATELPILIYFHGGSYLFGSTHTHADTIARLALAAQMRTFGPNYRLAPEHPYPAQLEDGCAGYRAFLARGIAPSKILLAGDSAGGNLVLSMLIALRDAGDPLPAGAALLSPWCDLSGSHPSMQANDPFDYGTREMLVGQARQFAGQLALDDPRISPSFADLSRLCPLLVHAGEAELLFDECNALVERAKEAGLDVTFEALQDMPHAGEFFADFSPIAAAAVRKTAAWLRDRAADR